MSSSFPNSILGDECKTLVRSKIDTCTLRVLQNARIENLQVCGSLSDCNGDELIIHCEQAIVTTEFASRAGLDPSVFASFDDAVAAGHSNICIRDGDHTATVPLTIGTQYNLKLFGNLTFSPNVLVDGVRLSAEGPGLLTFVGTQALSALELFRLRLSDVVVTVSEFVRN